MSRLEAAREHVLPRPYVLKPIAEGSSVGVFIVTEDQEHPPQQLFRDDWTFGDRLLAERYIAGKELTCAVMGDKALDVIDIVSTSDSTTMKRNMRQAAHTTFCPLKFYQKFTKRSEDWRWPHIVHSDVVA